MDRYQAQLDQVKFALANDPSNLELQSMAKDLEDLISLAAAQCSSKEANSKIKNLKNKQDWNLGDKVEAKNSQGQYLAATVTSMAADRSKYTVKFASSSEAAVVLSSEIRQPKKEIEQPIVEDKKKKKDKRNEHSGVCKAGEESSSRKRKYQSKEDYLQQKEQEQAVKQKAWQKFNDKAAKRGSAGIAKQSIFSSTSSAAGKERIMTSFNPRSKHLFQPSYEE